MRNVPLLTVVFAVLLVQGASAASEGMLETEPGVGIYWRALGQGAETVIIPGDFLFGGDMDVLANGRRVVLYDMRNRGRSRRVTDPSLLTLNGDVRDLEALRREVGAEKFSTIGYSVLGKLVILYALQYPERVERIVQIGPVGMRFGAAMPPVYDNTREDVMDSDALAAIRQLRSTGFHETNPQEYCEREWLVTRVRLVGDPSMAEKLKSYCAMENEWATNFAFHLQHHFASARETHVSPAEVRDVTSPVLTVHGTLDRNAPYGAGREWAATIPDARLLTVEGGAHQVWLDDPKIIDEIAEFLDGSWPARSEDLDISSEEWLSQLRGWELLTRVREATDDGGVDFSTSPVKVGFSGALYPHSQSARPVPPFTPFPTTDDVILDLASNRIAARHEMKWPNFTSRVRIVARGDEGFEVAGESSRASTLGVSADDLRLRYMRRLPAILIEEALRDPASIRLLGTRDLRRDRFSLVNVEVEDSRLTLWFDKDERLTRTTRLIHDGLLGDVLEETIYSSEESSRGWPRRVQVFFNRTLAAEFAVQTREAPNAEELRQAFELPAEGLSPASASEPLDIRRLADRVWLVTGIGGRDYRSLVVERDDALLLGETPLSREAMESVLDLLSKHFPDKSVRTAVVTHHHFDHAGGVTALMRAGAKIVTAPGNAAFFREIAAAPRTIDGGSRIPRVELELVLEDRIALPGSGPAVEVHRIEAAGHAEEMLFLWLPKERILFQGDLFVHFPDAPERARPQAVSLLESVTSRSLPVDRIVGVHGEVATLDDLRRAVERAGRPGVPGQ